MNRTAATLLGLAAFLAAGSAFGQTQFPTQQPGITVPGYVNMCVGQDQIARPCNDLAPFAGKIVSMPPITPYPTGAFPITGIASGTTGAVVGTLSGAVGKSTYICNMDVSAIGGTAAIGPIVVAGLTGGSFTYQASATAAGVTFSRTFTPCIPSNGLNTAITVTTTADGTASAVNVNLSGFQF